jgi:hypothetical protein
MASKEVSLAVFTSLTSAPDGSLQRVSSCMKVRKLVASGLTLTDPPWEWCSLARPTCCGSICVCSECSFSVWGESVRSCSVVGLRAAVWGAME